MKLKNILANFLENQNYYLAIFDNSLYLYRIIDIEYSSSKKIIVLLDKFKIEVVGNMLTINKLVDGELLILGEIIGVTKINE